MSTVTIYTTAWCPFCRRAEQFLAAKGVQAIERVHVDDRPDRRAEMIERSGRRSVPQIFIGDRHVGGYDDLVASDRAGVLQTWLTECSRSVGRG